MDRPEVIEVETPKAIFESDWVKKFHRPDFHRFSQSSDTRSDGEDSYYLMAEYRDGQEWWVVGKADAPLNLPEWKPQPRKEKQ